MNTAAVAAAMMEKAATSRKNVILTDVAGRFGLKYEPMVAPQKDGMYSLVRVFRGEDDLVADLDEAAAARLLTDWLGSVELLMPNAKIEARWNTMLTENGWAE